MSHSAALSPTRSRREITLALLVVLAMLVASCGGDDGGALGEGVNGASSGSTSGIRVVSPTAGAAIQSEPPEGLVILDVRTQEEFDEGHLEGATMIDFYAEDFADRLAELDPNVPYLLYCRSGNRSGQTTQIMTDLGFVDVADVDGGIVAWGAAGLPLAAG